MAMTLKQLTNTLRNEEYTPRTDADLQKEAEARVGENYDTMRGAAQQRQSKIDEAYAQQLQSLEDALATSNQVIAGAAGRSNAAIDDYMHRTSMQRTSYGADSKASTVDVMNQAAGMLAQQYGTARSGVENSRILLAEQLADTLAQYDQDYLLDVKAYIDEQKQIDYNRKVEADAAYNDIKMALYEYGKAGSGGGGGGYRRSSGGGVTDASAPSSAGGLWSSLASQTVQKTYNLNPSFGQANQVTQPAKATAKPKGELNREKTTGK